MNVEKIIVREGRVLLGFVAGFGGAWALMVIFPDKPFFYLLIFVLLVYLLYLIFRFVQWAIKLLKLRPAKVCAADFTGYAEMVSYLIKKRGISAIKLAEKMGVTAAYIAKIEKGEISPFSEEKEVIKAFIEERL